MSEQHTITSVGGGTLGVEPGDKFIISGTAAQEAEENAACVVELVETRLRRRRGKGTDDGVLRNIREYWTFDGKKVAEHDVEYPNPVQTIERLSRLLDLEKALCAEARADQEKRQGQIFSLTSELDKRDEEIRKLKNKILEVTREERAKKHRARKKAVTKKKKTRKK